MDLIYKYLGEKYLGEESIKIDGKDYKGGQVINKINKNKGKVIGTVFGSKSEVKKDLKQYEGKGYDFIYFVDGKLHVVRIIEKN